jgi:hypothetical protein
MGPILVDNGAVSIIVTSREQYNIVAFTVDAQVHVPRQKTSKKKIGNRNEQTPWLIVCKGTKPTQLLPRPANIVPTVAVRACCVVSAADHDGR